MFPRYWKLIREIYLHAKRVEVTTEMQSTIMTSANEAISRLRPTDADVIKRFYGLGCEPETLAQIGKDYNNISPERVRQIRAKAARMLKKPLIGFLLQENLSKAGICDPPDETDNPRFAMVMMDKVRTGQTLDDEELEKLSINWLKLTVLMVHVFKHERIETLFDVKKKTKGQLLRLPNFAHKSLAKLEQELAKFGVTLED